MNQNIKVYISYPDNNLDNIWEQKFKKFLEVILGQFLENKPQIIDNLSEEQFLSEYQSFHIFIALISPAYITSVKTQRELRLFYDFINTGTNNREVFKVEKSPIEPNTELPLIDKKISYRLYKTEEVTGKTKEIKDFFAPNEAQQFWAELTDLAFDIFSKITKKERDIDSFDIQNKRYKGVYLAETEPELFIQRSILKRELQRHGFTVYPQTLLSQSEEEFKQQVENDLEKCQVSVHLIGNHYGNLFHNSNYSLIDLQSQITREYAKKLDNKQFKQFIWLENDEEEIEDKQRNYVDRLIQEIQASEMAEVLKVPLEDLKVSIKETFKQFLKAPTYFITREKRDTNASIYLIYHRFDEAFAKEIEDFLLNSRYEILKPSFEGNPIELRERHLEKLRFCDAVLILYGKSDKEWVTMKVSDLIKIPGLGKEIKLEKKAIYCLNGNVFENDLLLYFNISILQQEPNHSSLKNFF